MIFFGIFILIPAYLAFRKGHNGVIITIFLVCCYALANVIALFNIPVIGTVVFWASLIGALLYIFLEPSGRGNAYSEIEEKYKVGDFEIREEEEISDDDWVVLATYTESWQQPDIKRHVQVLIDNDIPYRFLSGLIANIMVHPDDIDRALGVIEKEDV